eukprot:scaffold3077_cov162-Amphora_coffeaeformis.AAC.5
MAAVKETMPDIEEGKALRQQSVDFESVDPDIGLTQEQVQEMLEKWGKNEIEAPTSPIYYIFLRQFTGFLPILIALAALVSLAVQDFVDSGIIFAILFVNASLGFREEYHAKKALDELSNSIENEIGVRREQVTSSVSTKDLVPGDIVLLVGGTIVPADVKWIKGDRMSIDTAALTGEPVPRKYPSNEYGDEIYSGTTVVAGECKARVLRTGVHTEIGQAQSNVMKDKAVRVISVFQQKVMRVVQALVASCLMVVLAVLFVEGYVYDGFQTDKKKTLLDALSIMIASMPVALPLVLQVNLALGASFLAKEHHAIVTSIPALQDIASMSMLCSDKTGTLTTAQMSIIPDGIHPMNDFTKNDVIRLAYLCSNVDKKNDPIDRAIVRAFQEANLEEDGSKQLEIIGFNPTVKRVVSFVQKGDKIMTIAKGLPAKIINTEAGGQDDHECQWKVLNYNSKAFVQEIEKSDTELNKNGYKTIAIAVCDGDARNAGHGPWKFVGLLPMIDPPREDTPATIASLHKANISVKMITGDHVNVGKETARLIGLGTNIHAGEEVRNTTSQQIKNDMIWNADGFAAVLPSDKREVVLTLRNEFGVVTGMTGDGVNDAPALSAAQVGIAVEGATDAAKNAADLILTDPGLSPIYGAVLESRRIFVRIKAYVVYRVAASVILVLSLATILFANGCSVDALYIIILALINDISMIPVAYDNAKATTKPQLPRALKLVLMSLYYGIFHTVLALTFIFSMDSSAHLNNSFDLTSECDQSARGFIWLYLVLVTELAIFSVRSPSYFWFSMPSPYLIMSVLLTCVGCSFIALYALDLSGANLGWIWLWNVGVFIIVDVGKVPFREMIGDSFGETIDSDELVEVDKKKSDMSMHREKTIRYAVHNDSRLNPSDLQHLVQVRSRQFSDLRGMFLDGIIQPNRYGMYLLQSSDSTPTRTKAHSEPSLIRKW